jgi:uncharacterized protein (DUF58 family)
VLLLLASIVVLLIAINSGSNAVFALGFLICGLLVAAALQGRRALSALRYEIGADATAFAGESAACRVRILPAARIPVTVEIGGAVGLLSDGSEEIAVMRPTVARGWLPPERIWLATTWPVGLVRARLPIGLTPATLVYPRPTPSDRSFTPARDLSARRGDPDTLAGLVVATPADRRSHIAWKALARGDVLLARRFESEAIDARWLDWDACEGDAETRLSRLAGQVIAAARTDSPFGLRLPGLAVRPGHGSQHFHRCLRALALWGMESEIASAEQRT